MPGRQRDWWCTKEVAAATGRSVSSLNCARGSNRSELNSPKYYRVGGRVRYRIKDVESWMDELGIVPGNR